MKTKAVKTQETITWREYQIQRFKEDPEFAIEYLKAALVENADLPGAVLSALRSVSEALDLSLEDISRKAGISRASIYKALGQKGNPTLTTLTAILDAMGLRLSIEKKLKKKSQKKPAS